MILNVLDRVTLLGVLPEQGDFVTLKIVRQLRESLSFTEEELRELKITQSEDRINWNPSADKGKEIQIGEKATDIIVGALKQLNDQKKLTQQHYDLYEKFCV